MSESTLSKFVDFFAPPSLPSPTCEVVLVSPTLPTAAGALDVYPLLGSDLSLQFSIRDVIVVPELVDVPKFAEALSQTLARFPTFCGKLRHDSANGSWSIALKNADISVFVERQPSVPLPNDWVAADENLGALIEPVKVLSLANSEEPMVKVKLSFYPETNQTAIGIGISHILADGYGAFQFEVALSDFYQGKTPTTPPFIIPTPLAAPPPVHKPSLPEGSAPDPRTQDMVSKSDEIYDHLLDNFRDASPVCLRISATQASQLKRKTIEALGERLPAGVHISAQDAIAGLVVSTVNKFDSGHIDHIFGVVNIRSLCDRAHYGGNALTISSTKVLTQSEQTDAAAIALAMREGLIDARKPEVLGARVAAGQRDAPAMVNAGLIRRVVPGRGRAVVNATSSFDRLAAHFGHAGRVRYHTAWVANRYVRTFGSNPSIVNGEVVDTREGSIDVQFRVDNKIYEDVHGALTRELDALSGRA